MKIWIFAVIIISSLLHWPLVHFGFPPTHDGEYHIIRAYQFDKTLRDGDWYPRWQRDVNNGYGTPLMNYYYPLPYYVTSLFHFFGLSFINGYKLSLVFATIAGGVLFFLWARQFWGNLGGFVSATLYTFSPYHIVDLYVRGALGEVWSLAFFPGFLWSITILIKNKNIKYLFPSSLFIALLIFSHNILALMFFVFALAYCLILVIVYENKKSFIQFLASIFLGLGISAIFWMPALFEREYVRGLLIYNVYENFPQLYQLLIPSWGTGFSNMDISNQMSFQIGIINILAVLISIMLWFQHVKRNKKEGAIIAFFIFAFFSVLFLMLRVSYPVWESLPFFNHFQFPWRFLSLEVVITSFLAGSIVKLWDKKLLPYSIVAASVLLTIGYTKPAYYWEREDSYYFSRSNFMDGTNTPGNIFNTIWFNPSLKRQKQKLRIIGGKGSIKEISIKSTRYAFDVFADSKVTLLVNTAYFPGWNGVIDGRKVTIIPNKDGLITFDVAKGRHSIQVMLSDTPIRTGAKYISILSIATLLTVFLKKKLFSFASKITKIYVY